MKYLNLKKTAVMLCVWALIVMPVSAIDIHVATNGDDYNDGTMDAPLQTIQKAMEIVKPGDRILVHEGTYMITNRIKIPALNTNPELRCELRAWPEDAVGKVIIDGTNMNPSSEIEFKQSRCIYVNHEANYWTFYGLVLQNAKDNGMKIEGSYNIVECCTFRWNNNTGLQIGMFKDFAFEETQSLPISGKPTFNPNFSYCRYNKVINCDSYENADTKSYGGSDDGGDADGFAVKFFPGPGTEFHGCRAWTNSDDNWDLHMTYHPVVIDQCWAWHAGYMPDGSEGKNGDGFKLGGGDAAAGADYEHSVGAHVITNCVAFENLHKGFDQYKAYEGMYIFNCVAWGNDYNYRFPTEFKYGTMDIHNCIGWGAKAEKSGRKIGNHEFLAPNKDGYQDPTDGTTYNSWIEIDGCSPIKESYKPADGDYTPATQDHSGEFLSLSVADFMADREPDGSLPKNNFARLRPGSIFQDKGMPVIGFTPTRKMTEEECTAAGLEYITADDLYIPFNDDAPDFGAYENDGVPYEYTIPEKIVMICTTANSSQEITAGQAIADIVYELNDVATDAVVEGLSEGLSYVFDAASHTVTISGIPEEACTFKLTATGNEAEGVKPVTVTGVISLATSYEELDDNPTYITEGVWVPTKPFPEAVKEIYLAPDGDPNGDGTFERPWNDLQQAIDAATPGTHIICRGGTYHPKKQRDGKYTVRIKNSGTEEQPIVIRCYEEEKPVFDFANQLYDQMVGDRGILITGDYWWLFGLHITHAADNGIKLEGSYNRIERCEFSYNLNTGLQLGFGHNFNYSFPSLDSNDGSYCAYNDVIDCDSHHNCDYDSSYGSNAAGFACKMHSGIGNRFIRCRAWRNSDDGWDLSETDYDVVLAECWQWESGKAEDHTWVKDYITKSRSMSFSGNGNGFKLGGNSIEDSSKGVHYAFNCIAFGNNNSPSSKGFDCNNNQDGHVLVGCLAFDNSCDYLFAGIASDANTKFYNNVCLGKQEMDVCTDDYNAIAEEMDWNGWTNHLVTGVSREDFLSLDEDDAIKLRDIYGGMPREFARLAADSKMIDVGNADLDNVNNVWQQLVQDFPFLARTISGSARDIGPYERPGQISTGIIEISGLDADTPLRKFIQNGRLVIVKDGQYYNVQGQRIDY